MDSQLKARVYAALDRQPVPIVETVFVAPEIVRRDDAQQRKDRLAKIIAAEVVPRLLALHQENPLEPGAKSPSEDEIVELAHLVMSPNLQAATEYVAILRDRGLPMETLFVQLLQPAAQHLGKMWDNDECDFIDVTMGVGHLQLLLAVFNGTHDIPAISLRRRVLLTLTPGEQHGFGLAMVAKLMRAAGWNVTSDIEPQIETIVDAVKSQWYAVAGVTLSSELRIADATEVIAAIRKHSCNPAIGIMVGGPQLVDNPELVRRLGADETSLNATTAVLLAQKLFDVGAKINWLGTSPLSR